MILCDTTRPDAPIVKRTLKLPCTRASSGEWRLISAATLLTMYLGLELMSLSLYGLVAIDRDSTRGTEAAMKYFVLGALASGLLLYGLAAEQNQQRRERRAGFSVRAMMGSLKNVFSDLL